MEFFLHNNNLIFSLALVVLFGIAVLEGVGALLGFAFSSALDTLMPDVDLDADLEIGGGSPFTSLLGWLHVGKVPLLILLVVFLTSFGIVGLLVQRIALTATGGLLSGGLLALPVFAASLPIVSVVGGVLEKVLPKEESEAVSEDALIGLEAVITLGAGFRGNPTQGRVRDQFGQDHYVLLEPAAENEQLEPGKTYRISSRRENIYIV